MFPVYVPQVITDLIQIYQTHMHHADVIDQLKPFCETIRYIEFMNGNCVPLTQHDPFVYVEYSMYHEPNPRKYNRMLHMIRGYARPIPLDPTPS